VGAIFDGRYVLESVLGSGGMGIVFAARNLRTEKKVALKYLTAPRQGRTRASERRAARFLREAQAAGRVRHPNVVDMIDVGGDPAHPYLVMELLQGKSLHARMQQGPLGLTEAISILLSAMHGVSEAHRQGVIHRDIKPENIFLSESADGGVVPKVLDFGVSRITESTADEHPTTLTQAGNVIGTPSYMPLEQLRGKSDVDARADVYSLGVVLYEALSGRRPFEAQNAHDLAIKMATEAPARLVLRDGSVNAQLEGVVLRALERSPEDRYPSVEAFALALSNYRRARRPHTRAIALTAALLFAAACLSWWSHRALEHAAPEVSAKQPDKQSLENASLPALTVDDGTQRARSTLPVPGGAREQPELLPMAPPAQRRARVREPSSPRAPAPVAPPSPAPIERAKTLLPDDF
jgi:serine/threonine protein kinase